MSTISATRLVRHGLVHQEVLEVDQRTVAVPLVVVEAHPAQPGRQVVVRLQIRYIVDIINVLDIRY